MWWLVKVLILVLLFTIAYQDIKERAVYWFYFPILMGLLILEHYTKVMMIHFYIAISINIIVVLLVMIVLYIYARWKMKLQFFQEAFGLADALFFIAMALGFPTMSFIILFTSSLLFSLITSLFLQRNSKDKTVPLAGYISIFLMAVFLVTWGFKPVNLYVL